MVVLDGVDLDALNYIPKVPYNGTIPTGGDSLGEDLNIFYEVIYYQLIAFQGEVG
jgi:Amt family ammonium transporter